MIKAFIRLILSFIREDRDKILSKDFYIKEYTPRVIGTKIRRSRE